METKKKPVVKLTGADGNVFNLLGLCHRASQGTDLNWKEFYAEATSGDYDHALQTMMKYFEVK